MRRLARSICNFGFQVVCFIPSLFSLFGSKLIGLRSSTRTSSGQILLVFLYGLCLKIHRSTFCRNLDPAPAKNWVVTFASIHFIFVCLKIIKIGESLPLALVYSPATSMRYSIINSCYSLIFILSKSMYSIMVCYIYKVGDL